MASCEDVTEQGIFQCQHAMWHPEVVPDVGVGRGDSEQAQLERLMAGML